MNILSQGTVCSGQSASIDMLKDYSDAVYIPGELNEFRLPGMIADHCVGRISDNYPSRLYKSPLDKKQVIKKILKNYKRCNFNNFNIPNFKRVNAFTRVQKEIHKDPENAVSYAQKYIEELKSIYAEDDENFFLFDNPLVWGQHFEVWPIIFEPFKLLMVYRDPRDQLAGRIRRKRLFKNMVIPTADIFGGDRSGAVNYFLCSLAARFNHAQKIFSALGPEKAVAVSFESLINDSDLREQIKAWLGIRGEKIDNQFQPEISQNNIGIYKNYLFEEDLDKLSPFIEHYYSMSKIRMLHEIPKIKIPSP